MNKKRITLEKLHKCSVCHKNFKSNEIIHSDIIREGISKLIQKDITDWNESSEICRDDLHFYQNKYVHMLLESEKGELSTLEHQVLETMQQHELISITSADTASDHEWTLGESC